MLRYIARRALRHMTNLLAATFLVYAMFSHVPNYSILILG